MKNFTYSRKVNYYETDQMGIVHHSNYIRYMEEARLALLEELSLSYAAMEENGLLIPVLSASCTYKIPFRYGETFTVDIYPVFFNGIKLTLGYHFYGVDEKLHSTGESSHCFVDTDMRPLSLKKSHPDIYTGLLEWVDSFKEDV